MELLPDALGKKIPRLGEAPEQEDPLVWVKLTCEQAGWTWYIIEQDELPIISHRANHSRAALSASGSSLPKYLSLTCFHIHTGLLAIYHWFFLM
jgi:hypothetical protein